MIEVGTAGDSGSEVLVPTPAAGATGGVAYTVPRIEINWIRIKRQGIKKTTAAAAPAALRVHHHQHLLRGRRYRPFLP